MTKADAIREAQAALDERNERESAARKAQADAEWVARPDAPLPVAEPKYLSNPCPVCKEPMLGMHLHDIRPAGEKRP